MPKTGKMAAGIVYQAILKLFPETPSLQEGEGVLLKFEKGAEIHLNVQGQEPKHTQAVLAFYSLKSTAIEEDACFELGFDYTAKTVQAEIIRAEGEQPLAGILSGFKRLQMQGRDRISSAGSGVVSKMLYNKILAFLPAIEEGKTSQPHASQVRAGRKLKINILSDTKETMSLEVSNLGLKGFYSMDVDINKSQQTASVTAVSGASGRYPAYLPYPDGKEMMPHEREKFSQILLENLVSLQTQIPGRK